LSLHSIASVAKLPGLVAAEARHGRYNKGTKKIGAVALKRQIQEEAKESGETSRKGYLVKRPTPGTKYWNMEPEDAALALQNDPEFNKLMNDYQDNEESGEDTPPKKQYWTLTPKGRALAMQTEAAFIKRGVAIHNKPGKSNDQITIDGEDNITDEALNEYDDSRDYEKEATKYLTMKPQPRALILYKEAQFRKIVDPLVAKLNMAVAARQVDKMNDNINNGKGDESNDSQGDESDDSQGVLEVRHDNADADEPIFLYGPGHVIPNDEKKSKAKTKKRATKGTTGEAGFERPRTRQNEKRKKSEVEKTKNVPTKKKKTKKKTVVAV
jgi:hypothetical protein